MRQHGWSIAWDARIALPMLLPAFVGCTSRSGSISRSLCWRTKFYMDVHRGVWDHSFLLPICPADGHYALVAPCSRLIVPSVRRSTVGDRAFSVAGSRVWITLPEEIMTSQSLPTFRRQLKTWLFRKLYPDIIMWTRICLNFTINLVVVLLLKQFLIDWL